MLQKHRFAVLVCWVATALVGAGSYFAWPRTYEVFAQIQLVPSPLASKFEELAQRLLLPAEEDIESWMRVVKSDMIIEPALHKVGAITPDTESQQVKKLVGQTRDSISVIRDGVTKIFTIRVAGGDKKFIADITRALVEQFQFYNKETKTMQDAQLRETFAFYIEKLDKEIDREQELLKSSSAVDTIKKTANEARDTITKLASELKNELRKVEDEYSLMSLRYKESWPARQQCRLKAELLSQIIACTTVQCLLGLEQKLLESYQSQLTPAVQVWAQKQRQLLDQKSNLERLEKEYDEASAEHAKRTGDTRSAEFLARSKKDNETLRADMQQQIKKAAMSIEKTVNDFVVLTKNIIPPTNPVSPNPKQFILIFFLWAVGLSIAIIYLLELVDRSLHTVMDIQHRTGLEVVAAVPPIMASRGGTKEKDWPLTNFLVFTSEHYSPAVDSYRIARINIVSVLDKSLRDKLSLLITSAQPREGKSTTIVNLGCAFAEAGSRTLILDCNLRHGTLAAYFGINGEAGMNQVLAGQKLWPEVMHCTPFPGLHIVPAGRQKSSTAALIHAPVFHIVLDAVKEEYDIVLIDTAPALLMAEPLLIAPRVDGVLLVCASGMTTREVLVHAANQVEKTKGKLLGVILNHKEIFSSPSYYYSYGYGKERAS
jgi:capsular exopolysaccharide synthesis family protein